MPVRNTIRRLLDEKLKITRYEFSEKTKLAKATAYSLYENENQIPNKVALDKICDCFKIQPGELLEWYEQAND